LETRSTNGRVRSSLHYLTRRRLRSLATSHSTWCLANFRLRDGKFLPVGRFGLSGRIRLWSIPIPWKLVCLVATRGQEWQSCCGVPRDAAQGNSWSSSTTFSMRSSRVRLRAMKLRDLVPSDGETDVNPVEAVNAEVPGSTQSGLLIVDPRGTPPQPAASSHHASAHPRRLRRRQNVLGRHVTLSISAHGALVVLEAEVTLGQSLLLMNRRTGTKGRCVSPASRVSPRLTEGWLRWALSLRNLGSSFGPSARRLGGIKMYWKRFRDQAHSLNGRPDADPCRPRWTPCGNQAKSQMAISGLIRPSAIWRSEGPVRVHLRVEYNMSMSIASHGIKSL